MSETSIMIDKPEAFVSWCKTYSGGVKLQKRGAAIIMEYLSGHGKMLSTNKSGELYLNSEVETVKTTLDEIVDQVCDWNYKLLVDTRSRKQHPVDFLDYCRSSTQEKELEEHKFILDRIFKQTIYGKEIQTIAHNMALEMMKEMHLVPAGDLQYQEETGIYGKAAEKVPEYAAHAESGEAIDEAESMDEELGIVETNPLPLTTVAAPTIKPTGEVPEQGRAR